MRIWLIAAALLLAPTFAAAQTVVRPYSGPPFGAFAFGMSPADARAAGASVTWDAIEDESLQRGTLRSLAPVVEIGGLNFEVLLGYASNAVEYIRLTTMLPLAGEECAARHQAFVQSQIAERGPFWGGEYWYRFYEDPDGPIGRLENGQFVPAPSIAVRGARVQLPGRDSIPSWIETFDGATYGQAYYVTSSARLRIAAHFVSRGAENECRFTVSSSYSPDMTGGVRPSSGENGAARLAEILASAELVRPMSYLEMPTGSNVTRHYPSAAMAANVSGDVTMNCLALADGKLDCAVISETPAEYQFGEAAIRIARGYRADAFAGVVGKRTEVTIRFRLPE